MDTKDPEPNSPMDLDEAFERDRREYEKLIEYFIKNPPEGITVGWAKPGRNPLFDDDAEPPARKEG
jgi:hypothetical protein